MGGEEEGGRVRVNLIIDSRGGARRVGGRHACVLRVMHAGDPFILACLPLCGLPPPHSPPPLPPPPPPPRQFTDRASNRLRMLHVNFSTVITSRYNSDAYLGSTEFISRITDIMIYRYAQSKYINSAYATWVVIWNKHHGVGRWKPTVVHTTIAYIVNQIP